MARADLDLTGIIGWWIDVDSKQTDRYIVYLTQGGLGMAAGGNIGAEHAMFEPIHGSSPRDAGQDRVNPMAAVLSAAMMCDWLGLQFEDERLTNCGAAMEQAVTTHLAEGRPVTFDPHGVFVPLC